MYSKNVNFNSGEYIPSTLNKTNVIDITQLYYDTYKEIEYSLTN
jgi:hypothetical protein